MKPWKIKPKNFLLMWCMDNRNGKKIVNCVDTCNKIILNKMNDEKRITNV